ncbi:facilitated trehalose transporter Tret1-2 homolog [Macrosteles quadrilineatus]|uniref:facilitated trehalose transporter Tret1-2 homolog n=1 Tax=Macrosteles quadrilineatus TaxID=74068 RepID=UPI0023E1C83A|nr:facilitated trehalose transporter Tret1-2 homolog [Macrosteles quadrilineatus]
MVGVETVAAVIGGKHPSLLEQVARKKSLISQLLMNGSIVLLVTGVGMPVGFSAILLPQLQSVDSSLSTDDDQASWIASVHSIMTPVGAVMAGSWMDRYGRRRVLQAATLPLVLGWLLISLSASHPPLLVGRMMAGFAVGMVPATAQVLIGEISEPRLRGVFGSSPGIAYALGILVVYALGSVLPWRIVAVLGIVLPATGCLLLVAMPESPVWLVHQGRTDDARKALMWLRGEDNNKVNHELHSLLVHLKAEEDRLSQEAQSEASCTLLPNCLTCLARPEVAKPFAIILVFCLLQILSGSYIVIFYGVDIVSSAVGASDSDLQSLTVAVVTAAIRFVVSILTTVSLLRLGRRKIGIISGLGTSVACFLLVGYLQLKRYAFVTFPPSGDVWVISGLIVFYVALNTFGIFGLPSLMLGEVLPSSVRGFVSGFLVMLINLLIFSTVKLYPLVARGLGPSGVFLVFGVTASAITLYVYLFLPETKDRPLTQIEQYFATGKNFLWASRDRSLMAKNNGLV